MKECISSSPINDWRVDTDSEVNTIKGKHIGDVIYVVNTGDVYMWNGTAWQAQ